MTTQQLRYLSAIIFFIVTLSACSDAPDSASQDNADSATQVITEEVTPQASEPAPTDEATPQVTETSPPSPTPLVSNSGDYFISVSYTLDRTTDQDDDIALVVVSSLGNASSHPIAVSDEDLFLVDEDNRRYLAEPPNDETHPPLIGTEVQPNESFMGLVLFRLPPDAAPSHLEWCIAGDCEQSIQAHIP